MKTLEDLRHQFEILNTEFLQECGSIADASAGDLRERTENLESLCKSLRRGIEECAAPVRAAILPLVAGAHPLSEVSLEAEKYGEPGIAILCEALQLPDSRVRAQAAHAIALAYAHEPYVLKTLARALAKDADAYVREVAATALGQLGPAATPAVPDLIRALSDTRLEVQAAAAWALGKVGPGASAAISTLSEFLPQSPFVPGEAACIAMPLIGGQYELIVPALLYESFWEKQWVAGWALGKVAAHLAKADPAAVPALSPAQCAAKRRLVDRLKNILPRPSLNLLPRDGRFAGPQGLELIVARLHEITEDDNVLVRGQAALALKGLSKDITVGDDFFEALLHRSNGNLVHGNLVNRTFLVVDALAERTELSNPAQYVIRSELQKHTDWLVQSRAVSAIGQWGRLSRKDEQLLSNVLKETRQPKVRVQIEQLLNRPRG